MASDLVVEDAKFREGALEMGGCVIVLVFPSQKEGPKHQRDYCKRSCGCN